MLESALTQAKRLPVGPPVFRAHRYVVPSPTRPTGASRDERDLAKALRRIVKPAFDRKPDEFVSYMLRVLPEFTDVMNALSTVAVVRRTQRAASQDGIALLESAATRLRGEDGALSVAAALDTVERAISQARWLSKNEAPVQHKDRDGDLAGDYHFYIGIHQFGMCATFLAQENAHEPEMVDMVLFLLTHGAEEAYIATRTAMELRSVDWYGENDPMFADLQVIAP